MNNPDRLWSFLAAASINLVFTYFAFAFHRIFGDFGQTRYLLLITAISFTLLYFLVRSLLRQGIIRSIRLKQITVLGIATLSSILLLDLAFGVYFNVHRGRDRTGVWDRQSDRTLWYGEFSPSVYYPTRKNFQLKKPNQMVSADIYGWFYYPELLASPTITNSVLQRRHITYFIDKHGFRKTTPVEGANIFALGDSFTEGSGIDQDKDWPELLEKRIKRPIYNLGCNRSSPGQQVLLLEYLLHNKRDSFKIKHLLWMIFEGNDLEESYEKERVPPRQEVFQRTILHPLAVLPNSLADWSVLNRMFTGQFIFTFPGKEIHDPYQFDGKRLLYPLYFSSQHGYRFFEPDYLQRATAPEQYLMKHPNRPRLDHSIRKMVDLSKTYHFRITVLIAPSDARLLAPYYDNFPTISTKPYLIDYIKTLCINLKLEVIDLFPLLQPYAKKQLLYYRDDTHWNEQGHEIVADILESMIKFEKH